MKTEQLTMLAMKPEPGERFEVFATWAASLAELLDVEVGWWFNDTLATAKPGEPLAEIYWKWQERRKAA